MQTDTNGSAQAGASKGKGIFCQITKAPTFDGVQFNSAVPKEGPLRRIQVVGFTAEGQAEVKKTDLYAILDERDRSEFKELFGGATDNCFLKVGAFTKC